MATLPYISVAQARSLLLARNLYTPQTIPSDGEIGYRIGELETILTEWFGFRFPETDHVDLIRCSVFFLTLPEYPVVSVSSIQFRMPNLPNQPESFATTSALWQGGRTIAVPRSGYYKATYCAGYSPSIVATLEPFMIRAIAKYDMANGGFDWLTAIAGDVVEVDMPGGIRQRKEYKHSAKADPVGSRTIDRMLATFANYRRRVIT